MGKKVSILFLHGYGFVALRNYIMTGIILIDSNSIKQKKIMTGVSGATGFW